MGGYGDYLEIKVEVGDEKQLKNISVQIDEMFNFDDFDSELYTKDLHKDLGHMHINHDNHRRMHDFGGLQSLLFVKNLSEEEFNKFINVAINSISKNKRVWKDGRKEELEEEDKKYEKRIEVLNFNFQREVNALNVFDSTDIDDSNKKEIKKIAEDMDLKEKANIFDLNDNNKKILNKVLF